MKQQTVTPLIQAAQNACDFLRACEWNDHTSEMDAANLSEALEQAILSAPAMSGEAQGSCCCAAHHPNHGRCLQCPIHGVPAPPSGESSAFRVEHFCQADKVRQRMDYDATAGQFVCSVCGEEAWVSGESSARRTEEA